MKSVTDLTSEKVQPWETSADMRDNLDTTFVFHSVEFKESKHGEVAYAMVSETEGGEQGKLFMVGEKVLERLHVIDEAKDFPCEGKIVKLGRAYDLA